jgi:hypothetical protein
MPLKWYFIRFTRHVSLHQQKNKIMIIESIIIFMSSIMTYNSTQTSAEEHKKVVKTQSNEKPAPLEGAQYRGGWDYN